MSFNDKKIPPDATHEIKTKRLNIRWMLLLFDVIVFAACFAVIYFTGERGTFPYVSGICAIVSVVLFRFIFNIYRQVWRYGGVPSYIKLMLADFFACVTATIVNILLPSPKMNASRLSLRLYTFERVSPSSSNALRKPLRSIIP